MANRTAKQILDDWDAKTHTWADYLILVNQYSCIKTATLTAYTIIKQSKDLTPNGQRAYNEILDAIVNETKDISDANLRIAANVVWNEDNAIAKQIMSSCAAQVAAKNAVQQNNTRPSSNDTKIYEARIAKNPFDRRLHRVKQLISSSGTVIPFSRDYADVATSGYMITEKSLQELSDNTPNKSELIIERNNLYQKMIKDNFYKGVPALQNAYALIRLYGSDGGQYLINQKNERKWYEVDIASDQAFNYTSTPTTSALIDWGNDDPHGRTPYFFTDFIFAKYWNKITNNRLITLRRYPAPIFDNLKFPGMTGSINTGSELSDAGGNAGDSGSKKSNKAFTPMASAITYFGGETGNNLKDLLKFTTGVEWGEVQGSIWEANTSNPPPDNTMGIATIFPALGGIAEKLNVAAGNFDPKFIAAGGQLPPDPYKDGPYENRIQGPVNRIDKVMKRNPGIKFAWEGLKLNFEYVARPVGGINPKAVLLDILGNFLIIGSASAVFFGGAHRFMADPAKYPFIGGERSIEKLYSGHPIDYSLDAIKSFTGPGSTTNVAMDNVIKSLKGFWNKLIGGGNLKDSLFGGFEGLMTSGIGNLVSNEIAKKTSGQIPYLTGLKAILTGQPVGEWHVTIGNPLNPIAMIGNLICDNIEIEFNEELGPDDFPTEMKITVTLKHGMARDRDAIESVFNRGMGRLYNLPDSFLGSSDKQTAIDAYTQEGVTVGKMAGGKDGFIYHKGQDSRVINAAELQGSINQMGGSISIWNRSSFKIGFSENSNISADLSNELLRSSYRAVDWIAYKSLL